MTLKAPKFWGGGAGLNRPLPAGLDRTFHQDYFRRASERSHTYSMPDWRVGIFYEIRNSSNAVSGCLRGGAFPQSW